MTRVRALHMREGINRAHTCRSREQGPQQPAANIRASGFIAGRRATVRRDRHECGNFIFAVCEFGFSYLLPRGTPQENERPGGTFLPEYPAGWKLLGRKPERESEREREIKEAMGHAREGRVRNKEEPRLCRRD